MVSKKVKNFEDLENIILRNGVILVKAVNKKPKSNIVLTNDLGSPIEETNSAVFDYAIIVNANGSSKYKNGDIVVVANFSTLDAIAMKNAEDTTYIVLPEYNISLAVKPENFNFN